MSPQTTSTLKALARPISSPERLCDLILRQKSGSSWWCLGHGHFDDVTAHTVFDAADIGRATIRRFEAGRRTPIPNNLAAIRRALEDGGVEFIPAKGGKGVGVRLREDK